MEGEGGFDLLAITFLKHRGPPLSFVEGELVSRVNMSRPLINAREYRSVPVRMLNNNPSSSSSGAAMDIYVAKENTPSAVEQTRSVQQPPQSAQRPVSPVRRVNSNVPALDLTPSQQQRRPQSPLHSARSSRERGDAAPPRPVVIVNLENFESKEPIKTVLNSPRSLAACAEKGIHPTELLRRPHGDFLAPGVPEAVAAIRYQHFETRRQEKLSLLRDARAARIAAQHRVDNAVVPKDGNVTSTAAVAGSVGNIAVVRVAKETTLGKLKADEEALKRRQRAELVRERANHLEAQRERQIVEKQVTSARRVLEYRHNCEEDKLKVIELRRLRWADSREQMEHRRRQEEFQRQQRQSQQDERSKIIDKYNIVVAREQYLTPRARAERIRASSAHR